MKHLTLYIGIIATLACTAVEPLVGKTTDRATKEALPAQVAKFLRAVGNEQEHLVEAMLKDNPELVNAVDRNGNTPLHHAILTYYKGNILPILLGRGAKVNAQNNRGVAPLHLATLRDVDPMILLLNHGANVNIADNNGATPLHLVTTLSLSKKSLLKIAMLGGSAVAIMTVLGGILGGPVLAAGWGTIATIPTLIGTSIHASVFFRSLGDDKRSSLNLLTRHKANLNAQDKNGNTALHLIALAKGADGMTRRVSSAKLLVNAGANVKIKNNDGLTPFDTAKKRLHFLLAHTVKPSVVERKRARARKKAARKKS